MICNPPVLLPLGLGTAGRPLARLLVVELGLSLPQRLADCLQLPQPLGVSLGLVFTLLQMLQSLSFR